MSDLRHRICGTRYLVGTSCCAERGIDQVAARPSAEDVVLLTRFNFRSIDQPFLMLARIGDVLLEDPDIEVSGEAQGECAGIRP